ncbi:MAG TPA: hypothetical protein VFA26_07020 [Gemmataceae bacterium]|nr:hypothetical protein [Gemmataceae bacterium]
MSAGSSDIVFPDESSGFDSRDCIDIIIDGPGDTTVRPCRPSLLKQLMAEREKIARWEAWLKQQAEQKNRPDAANGAS